MTFSRTRIDIRSIAKGFMNTGAVKTRLDLMVNYLLLFLSPQHSFKGFPWILQSVSRGPYYSVFNIDRQTPCGEMATS